MPKNDPCLNLRGKNILVTGAAGFIGNNLVRELLRRRNRVVCLVRPGENTSGFMVLIAGSFTGIFLKNHRLWTP